MAISGFIPTPEEQASIIDVFSLLTWAGLSTEQPTATPEQLEEHGEGFQEMMISPMHSFLAWADIAGSDSIRALALTGREEFASMVFAEWHH